MKRTRLLAWSTGVLVLLIAVSACRSPTVIVDRTAYVVIDGAHYSGGPATSYNIERAKLSKDGAAQEIHAAVRGTDVYRLSGIDPSRVVIMLSDDPNESRYWILFRDGILPESANQELDWSFPTVPGLCHYLRKPPANCA